MRRLVMATIAAGVAAGSFVPALAAPSAQVGRLAQSLPVGVSQSSSGTTVHAGEVGVFVGNNGEVCPLVSTQDWQCVNLS